LDSDTLTEMSQWTWRNYCWYA